MKKRHFLSAIALAFAVSTIITSCKKDDDDNNNNNNNNNNNTFTLTTPANVTGTLAGTDIGIGNGYSSVGWSGLPDMSGSNITYSSSVNKTVFGDPPTVSISLGNKHYPDENIYGATEFYNYIKLGASAYTWSDGSSSGNTTTYKVGIGYEDANGDLWSSAYGTQTGSTFEILDTLHSTTFTGGAAVKIKAKFNCKVYDMNGNNPKQLNVTNYIGVFETYP